ncbi:MAG: hypothetical protein IIZ64_00060 [Erysipelotrichaceae bacterium]|nr:hypothetical protein [Erysipelotrichaceae bacterium]
MKAAVKYALCIAIAWFITNGWAYVCVFLGMRWKMAFLTAVASAYLTFLWLPFTPEKIVTLWIAHRLSRIVFRER